MRDDLFDSFMLMELIKTDVGDTTLMTVLTETNLIEYV